MPTLGDYIRIKHGYAFKGDYITVEDNGVVLVTPGNFEIGGGFKEKKCKFFSGNYPNEYVLNANDLIVTMTDLSKQGDTLGYSARVPNSERIYLHNQRIGLVDVFNPAADKDYIYWFMRTPCYQRTIVATASGSTVKHTSPSRICAVEINLPPIDEQRKIASLLSSLEEKIRINGKTNDNLEEQSKVIFDKLFPNISNGSYTVGNYITPKRGKNLLSKNAVQGNVPVVAGGLVPSVYHNTSNTKAPVLAISASGANAGYVSLWNIPIWASDSSYIDSSMTNNVYFWYVLLKKRQKEIFDAQTGSAQPHIYPQHIAGMPIKELEVAKIQEFNAMVTPIFEKIGKNLKENTQLKTLRDILLPKLMSGEIDISAVQF